VFKKSASKAALFKFKFQYKLKKGMKLSDADIIFDVTNYYA